MAIEAMAAAVPVVAASTGGLPEIVRHNETGLLVPDKHPRAIAAAILELASDPEKRAMMGAAGKKRHKEEYTVSRHVKRVLDVYSELLTP